MPPNRFLPRLYHTHANFARGQGKKVWMITEKRAAVRLGDSMRYAFVFRDVEDVIPYKITAKQTINLSF
jgi:hypothetical protein